MLEAPAAFPPEPDYNRLRGVERGGLLKRRCLRLPNARLFVAAATAVNNDVVANVADRARIHLRELLVGGFGCAAFSAGAGPNDRSG